jgi:hypothetical protein
MKRLLRVPLRILRKLVRLVRGKGMGANPAAAIKPRDIYSIAIYEGSSPLDLKPAENASNPVLTAADVTDLKAIYVADPFMIHDGDMWHMFLEILPKSDEKGVIGLASSKDGLKWNYRQVVLSEAFHLSYPYVFQVDGAYYMVPESHQDRSVRLYKALEFPIRWEHVANLLEGEEFVDCSPFFFEGAWWMFAGCGGPPCHANTLRLFHATQLTGPWHEHPSSPVIRDNHAIARPGGRVVVWDGRLLRFTQDCHPYYGQRLRAFEIHELTPQSYGERLAAEEPILAESHHGWNAAGMHHIDPHLMKDGRCMASVDGWCWGGI